MSCGWCVGIVAVDSETWALRQRLTLLRAWNAPGGAFWRGRLDGCDVVVAQTAPGKVNAALAAQSLLASERPAVLLSVGTAGAVGEVGQGDLVLAHEVGYHDAGLYLGGRFIPHGGFTCRGGRRRLEEWFRLCPATEQAARAWAGGWAGADRLHWGRVVTGDQVILSAERKRFLRERFGALAVEMESAAVAQVARSWDVPWLVVRAVSDGADQESGFDFTPLSRLHYASAEPGQRLASLLEVARLTVRDPSWRRKLAAIHKGLRQATQRATEAALSLALSPELRAALAAREARP
ncbi:MAG: 5'-methylthioadenosine/S-adenosylhomocysteine nucleosidase [Chloroflexi bacterium]|nr:5'-methylthioadenosine/S-adenosylhomocysteine nucleosidase [Chloroflexota bacterium]